MLMVGGDNEDACKDDVAEAREGGGGEGDSSSGGLSGQSAPPIPTALPEHRCRSAIGAGAWIE